MSFRHLIHLIGALVLLLLPAAALAAPAGDALLQSYAGEWRGRGVLKGETSETVVCRLSLQPSLGGKFSYSGRCALAGETIDLRGTLDYDEQSETFVARSSAKSYRGVQTGGGVVFTMSQEFRREGHAGTFSAGFSLTGGTIKIDFRIEDTETGLSTARIPLKKS